MNMLKAFLYQCKNYGFINGFFIDKNSRGIFSKYSHMNKEGKVKVCYKTNEGAAKAAQAMNEKHNKNTLAPYKCGFCDFYHIGNNK